MKKNTVLMILDGFGCSDKIKGNAVKAAHTPSIDHLMASYPHTYLGASGNDVGLPNGQMGNSEVGHLNIGAGRIVYQELTRITKSIKDNDFFDNKVLLNAIDNVKQNNSALHLFGLLSDGGVHSHNTHLYALLQLAKKNDIIKVYVHAFLDGRDVPPRCAAKYIEALEDQMKEIGIGQIATISGRYYAMDRDKRWERVEMAYNAITNGHGQMADSAIDALNAAYERDESDEFVKPTVIVDGGQPVATVASNDSIIMYNFRPDRAREITRTFVDPDFDGFERKNGYFPVAYVCMTQYDATMPNVLIAFPPQKLNNTLGEYISGLGLNQLRIAETEKYAHVTFFFNGGVEEPNKNEARILIPSPKVATYDLQPEMSAYEVTDKVIEEIQKEKHHLIILNFANPDMVGHTGIMEAAVEAIECLDKCVKRIVDAVQKTNGELLITSDHGNADVMLDEDDNVVTAHSLNPVPLILVSDRNAALSEGILADIAPTLLELMGLDVPEEMTGNSLVKEPVTA